MKKTKEIFITTETRETVIVRRRKTKSVRCFCPACKAKSEMVSVSEAVAAFDFGIREIVEAVQTEKLHLLITRNRRHLLCANSLARLSGEIV